MITCGLQLVLIMMIDSNCALYYYGLFEMVGKSIK